MSGEYQGRRRNVRFGVNYLDAGRAGDQAVKRACAMSLSANDMKVLCVVLAYTVFRSKLADETSLGQLVEIAGLSKSTVQRSLVRLEDAGLVRRGEQHGRRPCQVELPLDGQYMSDHPDAPLGGHLNASGGQVTALDGQRTVTTSEIRGEDSGLRPESPLPPRDGDDDSAQEGYVAADSPEEKNPKYRLDRAMTWMRNAGWIDPHPEDGLRDLFGDAIPDDDLIALLELHSDLNRQHGEAA